jgi:hypothetical protein
MLLSEGGKARGKKKISKKRCLDCLMSFERTDGAETCTDCKKAFHTNCIAGHKCDIYKFDDGLSFMSGAEF